MSERTVEEQEELEKITSEVERAVKHSLMLRVLDKSVVNKLAEKFGFKPEEAAVFVEPELPEGQLRPDIVLVGWRDALRCRDNQQGEHSRCREAAHGQRDH